MQTTPAPAVIAAHAPTMRARLTPLAFAIHMGCVTLLTASYSGSVQAGAAVAYDIPAGPLDAALTRFAQQSGVAISVDAAKLKGLRTPGLRGSYGVEEGFAILLHGSGYAMVRTSAGYTLVPAPQQPVSEGAEGPVVLSEVAVEATATAELPGDRPKPYAGGQVATGGSVGILGNKSLMDTPFSITSYTRELIQNQQASTLVDLIANEPSMRSTNPKGGRFEQFSIRGFRLFNSDVGFNGLFGLIPTYTVPVEGAERVEVLKGPNALLTGMAPSGAVGGAVNFVSKRADDAPLTQVTASYGNESQAGLHADVGRRFGQDNQFGIRLNAVRQDGDTSFTDQSVERGVAMLGLDFRGEKVRLYGDLLHQERRGTAPMERVAVANGAEVPDADKIGSNFAQKWTYANTIDTTGLVRGELDLTEDTTTYAAFGAKRGRYDFMRMAPVTVNSLGNFTARARKFLRDEDAVSGEAGIRTVNIVTGPVTHAVNLNASVFKLQFGNADALGSNITSNIYNPADVDKPSITLSDTVPRSGETELTSFALTDTLSFLQDRVQLTLGARQQRVVVKAYDEATGVKESEYDKNALTPAVALLVKASDRISLFGNYIEALSQGPTPPSTADNSDEVFAPTKTKQVEAGVKFDWGRLGSTFSIFRIEQPSGFTDASTNVFSVNGEQRNTGFEWSIFGEPTSNTRILGGLMWLDGELTKTANGQFDGNTAVGVARINANLGGEWDTPFLPGMTLTARLIYTGDQYLDQANTREIPDWTRMDIGARYVFETSGKTVTLRANVENLFDERYWESASDLGLSFGTPRTAIVSATIDF
jgi:iron complex outermembrane receptor protein